MLKRHLSYNLKSLKKAIIMLSVAGIPMASCSKDDKEDAPVPQHDTEYIWGTDNWEILDQTDKIKASADSAEVRYVILKCDGKEWGGWSATKIRKEYLSEAFAVSPKVKGAGDLNRVMVETPEHKADSAWLSQQGYKFGKLYQRQK